MLNIKKTAYLLGLICGKIFYYPILQQLQYIRTIIGAIRDYIEPFSHH